MITKRTPNEIPVVFSSDNNYVLYLGVAIKSLIVNADLEKDYTIYILHNDISESNQRRILSLETENIKIKFISIISYIEKYNKNLFRSKHLSVATYFRFLVPTIFINHEKILYFDCDAIFNADVAEAFEYELNKNLLGAVRDPGVIRRYLKSTISSKYFSKVLKLKHPFNYFNAGMLIMNLTKMREIDFFNTCIKKLKELKNPKYNDQDVLNCVCEDNVKFIDDAWNVECDFRKRNIPNLSTILTEEECKKFCDATNNIKFLHYWGLDKPWHEPGKANADYFWKYARQTPFYEEILYKNITNYKKPSIYSSFSQRLFSVINCYEKNKKYKILTILGIAIKIQSINLGVNAR